MFTASMAAIKGLVSASGIPELSGTVRLWEIDPGIYFVHEGTTIYPARNIGTAVSYDSILILSDFLQRYNYKYYIIYNTVGQITYGQARENGGSAKFSNITPFQGASEQYQGSVGTVPAPQAGNQDKFLRGDGTWGEPDVFDGATALAAGKKGFVPAPQAGDNEKFLKGDGTWGDIPVMQGANWLPQTNGNKGLVPIPTFDDVFKCLKGNGEWGHSNAVFTCALNPTTDSHGFYKHRIRMVDFLGTYRIYTQSEIASLIHYGYNCTLMIEDRRPYEHKNIFCRGVFRQNGVNLYPVFEHINVINGLLTIGYYSCIQEDGIEYWIYNLEKEIN